MKNKVDIFKRLPNGKMVWVRAVDGIEEAETILFTTIASAA